VGKKKKKIKWKKNIKGNINNYKTIINDYLKIKYKNLKKLPMMQHSGSRRRKMKSESISNTWRKIAHLVRSIINWLSTVRG
jgi:hypothetical protein